MRVFSAIILLLLSKSINAIEWKDYGYSASYKYAFIIPHTPEVYPLIGGTFPIIDLTFNDHDVSSNGHDVHYPNSYLGYSMSFSPLGNNDKLGYKLSGLVSENAYMGSIKNASFFSSIGAGLILIQNPFNAIDNPQNLVIGSYLNFAFEVSLSASFALSNSVNLDLLIGLEHYSNGALYRPNRGLNIPFLGARIRTHSVDSIWKKNVPAAAKKDRWLSEISYGTKRLKLTDETRYHVMNLKLGRQFNFRRDRKFLFYADIIYDNGIQYAHSDFERWDVSNWLVGIYTAYEKRFGNIGITVGSGVYLLSPYNTWNQSEELINKGSKIYNRIGFKRYFKQFYAAFNIKAHIGDADNVEFGIGYLW